ncbi:hypothetical protein N7540_005668 [Penicillium herquei]|nr:hypothetical protein N7540_005668 [Penicillium herquei]
MSSPAASPTASSGSFARTDSHTLTVDFGQEPFKTFQGRVIQLCGVIAPPNSQITVERMKGGTYNRVVAITWTGKDDCKAHHFILRVPRDWPVSLGRHLGPLHILHQQGQFPVPEVIKFDTSLRNILELPYMLQVRIPGTSLDFTYHDLPQKTKCAIATRVGQVFAALHSIRSVVAGRPTMSMKEVKVARFRDPEEHWCMQLPELVPYEDGPASQSTFDLIHAIIAPQLEREIAKNGRVGATKINDLQKVLTVASEMHKFGVWGEDGYCLCHMDMAFRNIMAEKPSLTNPSGITGILDWDSAIFAPLVMSCTPPRWLWASYPDWIEYGEDEWYDTEDFLAHEYLSPESCELKQCFEDAAGPVYARLGEGPQYRLARRLLRDVFHLSHYEAHPIDFDEVVEQWAIIRGPQCG